MVVDPLKVTPFWKVVVELTVRESPAAVPSVALSSTFKSLMYAVLATPIPPSNVTLAVSTLDASVVFAKFTLLVDVVPTSMSAPSIFSLSLVVSSYTIEASLLVQKISFISSAIRK